jgi:SAM-dependent methyltransferase
MSEQPWYRTFFERDYHDLFYATLRQPGGRLASEATEREVEFIADTLGLAEGARILDLCCGHGRHSIELAQRGYDVTGLDLSEYHIELARKAADEASVRATFVCDDMRNLPTSPPFDAVINIFTAFGYLESDEEDASVIARVRDALVPGGKFLISTNNALRTLRGFQPSSVQRLDDGTLLIEERKYDAISGRIDSIWTRVEPDGKRHEGDIHVRMYTPAEYAAMFRRCGLGLAASYGDVDGSPLTMDSPRLVLVAEKE